MATTSPSQRKWNRWAPSASAYLVVGGTLALQVYATFAGGTLLLALLLGVT